MYLFGSVFNFIFQILVTQCSHDPVWVHLIDELYLNSGWTLMSNLDVVYGMSHSSDAGGKRSSG